MPSASELMAKVPSKNLLIASIIMLVIGTLGFPVYDQVLGDPMATSKKDTFYTEHVQREVTTMQIKLDSGSTAKTVTTSSTVTVHPAVTEE